MKPIQPDFTWYQSVSKTNNLLPRCPFASVHRCPRFYQSLSLLGHAGSTEIDPGADSKLKKYWESTDLWPVTLEQATAISGPKDSHGHFMNFCPEVAFERFGLFASDLHEYADETDHDLAHARLARDMTPSADWRWYWATVNPMHYSQCPLYSLLERDKGNHSKRMGSMKTQDIQRKILEVISENEKATPGQAVRDKQIAEKLELNLQEVQDDLDLMEERNYVKLAKTFGPNYAAWLTPQGRLALREPEYFSHKESAPVINILNVINSQIQNLAQTGGNTFIKQSSDSMLNDHIFKLIDQMVEVVVSSNDIVANVKQDYELEAGELKNELKKSRINLSRVREMLSFLGDLEGILGLAERLAPYLLALSPRIEQLFK
jgi:hypothetical protein